MTLFTAASTAALAAAVLIPSAPATADDDSVSYLAPEYQTGELTGDEKIDQDDIALIMERVGTTELDPAWPDVSAADYDADGVITVSDVAQLSQRYLYDDDDFEILETSVVDIQKAMTAGTVTSEELVQDYLDRIAAYDRTVGIDTSSSTAAAERFESINWVNPNALEQARALDAERAETGPRSMLHGVPIIVKDLINDVDMPTTAGCGCLEDNLTSTDAETVERLKDMGAIVIAKANLSEFAQSTTTSISHYGTTRNSYGLSRDPGGSSGGTGSSISANFATFGLGSDTGGSIRVPSSFNALVGVRPTVGLISREGVIPLDGYRDTVGPMARSVSDAALALDAMAGTDPDDATTVEADAHKPESYAASLDPDALDDMRIGYISGLISGNANSVGNRLVPAAIEDLEDAGAEVVDVGAFGTVNGYSITSLPSSRSFTHDMNLYLDRYYEQDYTFEDLADKVAQSEVDSPGADMSSWPSSTIRNWAGTTDEQRDEAYPTYSATQQAMRDRIDGLMEQYDLDALIYPSTGGTVGSPASNNRISAYSGYPAVSVPMGFADSSLDETSYNGFPMGLEFLAEPYSEEKLLGFAYAYEQQTHNRRPTTLFPDLAE